MDRRDLSTWISGPRAAAAAAGVDWGYRGQRLGLPEQGPGSLAGFGRRLAALALDWLAALAITRLVLPADAYGTPRYSLITLAVFGLEVFVLTRLAGASLGQRLLGVRVVSLVPRPLGWSRALVRTVLLCLAVPALIWDRDGRGMHDRAVATAVIRVVRVPA